jgi:hypothetical protein
MKDAHWDPADHERSYYRHVMTGDLGWMVRRDGKDCIRLDRPNQEIVKPFREQEWIPEHEHRPITRLQLVQIAYEADRKLCFFLGLHADARKEWASMREQDRLRWAQHGPGAGPGRQLLFTRIMAALDFLAS